MFGGVNYFNYRPPRSYPPITRVARKLPQMPTMSIPLRRFEFREGRSNKYWEVQVDDGTVTTHWGRIGAAGSFQQKKFGSHFAAKNHADKQVREKLSKGYNEVTAKNSQPIPTSFTEPAPVQPAVVSLPQPPAVSTIPEEKQKRAFRL